MAELFVCRVDEIADGDVRIVEHDSFEIGIIRRGERYFAYRNLCPHQGGPSCEGLRLPKVEDVIDERGLFVGQRFNEDDIHIVCPWHGYEYHLETGEHVCNTRLKLHKHGVVARDGGIYVEC
jgi:nitrite reductase/ring-hydroxylating ferredoxin subunit